MFDVVDLPVPTFGNCVLKTGVIKWPLKPHGLLKRFLTFFSESQNTTFYGFLNCCARFLEYCVQPHQLCAEMTMGHTF